MTFTPADLDVIHLQLLSLYLPNPSAQVSVHVSFTIIFCNSPQWAGASSFTAFLDHTQRRTTVFRAPLDQ